VSTRNLELTQQAFEAINRRDLDWLIAHCDPGVEMHMRGVAGEPVRYVGPAGVREYFRDIAEIWESVEFVPEEIRDLGDSVRDPEAEVPREGERGRRRGQDLRAPTGCATALLSSCGPTAMSPRGSPRPAWISRSELALDLVDEVEVELEEPAQEGDH